MPFLASGKACKDSRGNYGGQAVLEGVMIRSPQAIAVAVRRGDGRIVVKREPLVPYTRRHPLFNVPFIRGAFALADALVTGLRALSFSADVAMEEEQERAAAVGESGGAGERETTDHGPRTTDDSPAEDDHSPLSTHHSPVTGDHGPQTTDHSEERVEVREVAAGKGIPWWSLASSLLISAAVVVAVFVVFPDLVANLLRGRLPSGQLSNVGINLVEGLLRVALFVGYILAISRMEAIRRVFQYHGAEHQVIHAYEHGDVVTPAAAARYDTAHPRCGTSFLAVVVVVSILAFSLLNIHTWYVRQALKLVLMPVVGGVSYEVIRLAGAGHLTFLVTPGLWLQRLTTRWPERDQVQVAMAALQGVLEQEGRSLNRAAEAAGD